MPLISNHLPELEQARSQTGSIAADRHEEPYLTAYDDYAEGDDDGSVRDASRLDRPRLRRAKRIAIIPQRDKLRALQISEGLNGGPKPLEVPQDSQDRRSIVSDPYESYVSSEEDASESADEFYESFAELESDSQSFLSTSSGRSSQEVVARAVSLMSVGRAQIIDIFHSRSRSADETLSPAFPSRRRRPALRLDPKVSRSPSPCTSPTSSKRQKRGGITGLENLTTKWPKSASANTTVHQDLTDSPSESSIPVPKTPTALANAVWKGGVKGVSRTINLAKTRPNIQKTNSPYTTGQAKSSSTHLLSLPLPEETGMQAHGGSNEAGNQQPQQSSKFERPWKRMSLSIDAEKLMAPTGDARSSNTSSRPPLPTSVSYRDVNRDRVRGPPPTPVSPKATRPRGGIRSLGIIRGRGDAF
ncbi:MAG: hypothetical protein M1818_008284 [Claussenomyces sp. TS43310]|nr:MAG: hypothetical protein M1818_008284 [Claussenomyces sp. TS43310]